MPSSVPLLVVCICEERCRLFVDVDGDGDGDEDEGEGEQAGLRAGLRDLRKTDIASPFAKLLANSETDFEAASRVAFSSSTLFTISSAICSCSMCEK